jgi:hypothetical protein
MLGGNRGPAFLNDQDKPRRKRLNADKKRALNAAHVQRFVTQYGRRAQKGVEPNDRRFDEKVERRVKQMKPDRLDQLLREDEE